MSDDSVVHALSRRRFLQMGGALVAVLPAACLTDPDDTDSQAERVHLTARPGAVAQPLPPGKHPLGLGLGRDGFIYVPEDHVIGQPLPLMVLLHGATGRAWNWDSAIPLADELGMALMAPDARGATWDVVRGSYGPDVAFIDAALETTFSHVQVDPARLALAGFSDGASYTLGLGLGNGDLFTHLVAWSPGFMPLAAQRGQPQIFVSHGTQDQILSVQITRGQIVPELEAAGYSVTYEEFEGIHEIPREVAVQAMEWVAGVEVAS